MNLRLDSVLMARVPGMDWGLYRVVTTSHAPLLCSGTLAILRPLPAHQTPAHSALSRSQTKAGAFQNYTVEYVTVSLQSWYFYDSDIAHRALYEHSVHFVAQCAALSNYPEDWSILKAAYWEDWNTEGCIVARLILMAA